MSNIWHVVGATSVLPLLSLFAVLLRGRFFVGKVRTVLLVVAFLVLSYSVSHALLDHGSHMGSEEIIASTIAALLTAAVLAIGRHEHTHKSLYALVGAEFLHSLADGFTIGMAYLVNPLLGYGALIGIVAHEAPKILATMLVIRSMTNSAAKTVGYSMLAQAGVPLVGITLFLVGAKVDPEYAHIAHMVALGSLVVVLLYMIGTHFFRGHEKLHPHPHH